MSKTKAIASDRKVWVALVKCIDYIKPDWYCRKGEGWVVMSEACARVMIKAIAPNHDIDKVMQQFRARDKGSTHRQDKGKAQHTHKRDTQGALW